MSPPSRLRLPRIDEDAASTIVVVLVAALMVAFDSTQRPWLSFGALALSGLVLMLKRRYPVAVLAACAAIAAVAFGFGGAIGVGVLVLDALYVVGRYSPRRTVRLVGGVVALAVVAGLLVPSLFGGTPRDGVLFGLQTLALLATPLWWASSVRQSAELARVQEERANDAARMLELERADAVRAERAKMALDLHDVVAANLSAIAITSEAALGDAGESTVERRALRAIRSSALEGLDEMRSMIVILRAGTDSLTAPPRLEQLQDLMDRMPGVNARLVGSVPAASAAIEQVLARVVLEAISNAARHSRGAEATVRFEAGRERVGVEVRSWGGSAELSAAGTGNGLGLVRERVERLGGTFSAGPTSSEAQPGWLVVAHLPTRPASPTQLSRGGGR